MVCCIDNTLVAVGNIIVMIIITPINLIGLFFFLVFIVIGLKKLAPASKIARRL